MEQRRWLQPSHMWDDPCDEWPTTWIPIFNEVADIAEPNTPEGVKP